MVDGVHRRPADGRPDAQMAAASRISQILFSWSMFATWPIVAMHSRNTWRISPEGIRSCRESPFLGHELGGTAGGPDHFRACARHQLDIVQHGSFRDAVQRQGVSDLNVRFRPGKDRIAGFKPSGCKM